MQTDMMRDFFNKQNELLEREHRFQRQQDDLIMKTFQEQTREIMYSVKQLENENVKPCRGWDDETETVDEEEQVQNREEDTEMEQDTEDIYTDDEQQQDQIEEHDENTVEDEHENEDYSI
ncbi:hypothetical protein EVAR_68941_1 [Eumeta japonica]|uniref:Uncharacterized protein n=1 Tax=Eumeta variegata TaxID=151549 RepID=A0A4C1SLU6_EUMVA|nr:hypothetical protein EVAR_68941_1 [Eumeta japonica]